MPVALSRIHVTRRLDYREVDVAAHQLMANQRDTMRTLGQHSYWKFSSSLDFERAVAAFNPTFPR